MTGAINKLIADNLWRDISEAPKDGTSILLSDGEQCCNGEWRELHPDGYWHCAHDGMCHPLFWMPLDSMGKCANALKIAVEALNKIQSSRETVRLATLEYQGQKTYAAKIADDALAEINRMAENNLTNKGD